MSLPVFLEEFVFKLDSIFSLNILWNSSVKPPRTEFFVETFLINFSLSSDKVLTRLFVLE